MPIIIRPTVTKGIATTLTLDKDILAALGLVVTDPYYADQSNWKSVSLLYTSANDEQNTTVMFDCTQAGNLASGRFKVSHKARGSKFFIAIIRIIDFDGGSLIIKRSDISTAEWDVNLIGIQPPESLTAEAFQNPDGSWYVDLTFSAVSGASSYMIYRGTSSGVYTQINSELSDYDGDYVFIGNVKVSFDEYQDDMGDMESGDTLFYMVRSYLEQESSDSPEATVTIP